MFGQKATFGAIVSTPYLYAEEVLAEGRGLLVSFSSDSALADAILRYLIEQGLMSATRRRSYRYAQSMFWPHVGREYLDVFAQAAGIDASVTGPVANKVNEVKVGWVKGKRRRPTILNDNPNVGGSARLSPVDLPYIFENLRGEVTGSGLGWQQN